MFYVKFSGAYLRVHNILLKWKSTELQTVVIPKLEKIGFVKIFEINLLLLLYYEL